MSSILFLSGCDLSDSMRKLVNDCFEKVDGVLVEKTANGYIVFGRQVSSMESVKEIIAGAKGSLSRSIRK